MAPGYVMLERTNCGKHVHLSLVIECLDKDEIRKCKGHEVEEQSRQRGDEGREMLIKSVEQIARFRRIPPKTV